MHSTGLHFSNITYKSSFRISVDADTKILTLLVGIVLTSYGFWETIINIERLFLSSDFNGHNLGIRLGFFSSLVLFFGITIIYFSKE
jgi:hypothetical protein